MKLYDDMRTEKVLLTRKVARVLFMTLEHEAMHAETLLYMLIQKAAGGEDGGMGTIPPPGFAMPNWEALKRQWDGHRMEKNTVVLGPEEVVLGHDDIEAQDTKGEAGRQVQMHEFGWDNETPKRKVKVDKFEITWRPVTNREFYDFYKGPGAGKVQCPASWLEEGGVIKVGTGL